MPRLLAIVLGVVFVLICVYWILAYFVRRTIAGELRRRAGRR